MQIRQSRKRGMNKKKLSGGCENGRLLRNIKSPFHFHMFVVYNVFYGIATIISRETQLHSC